MDKSCMNFVPPLMSLLDAHGFGMSPMYRGAAWQLWFHDSQRGSLCDVAERRSSASFIKPSNMCIFHTCIYTKKNTLYLHKALKHFLPSWSWSTCKCILC